MKKLLISSMLLVSFGFQAQQTKIETGVYKGSTQGQEIMLKLNEDKTFEMTFFYGNYTIDNDSIHFNNSTYDTSKFKLKPIVDADYSSTLKLQFDTSMDSYYGSDVFIGTQKNQNTQITYQRLSELVDKDDYNATIKSIMVDVPKCQFLYLVSQNYDRETEVAKYEINENVNALAVEYNPYSFRDIKLIGYIDEESHQLAITDAKKAVFFTIAKDNGVSKNDKSLNVLSVTKETDWAKKNGFESDYVNDFVDGYTDAIYNFKHVVDNSFDTALTTLKKAPSKFLVVAFDGTNSKRQEDFNKFITSSETVISSYMYDTYNKEYDRFNFYLATDKDKKMLEKNAINSSKEILVYNSDGDLIYHTAGTLSGNSDLFVPYSYLISQLEKANVSIAIDKAIENKKSSLSELTTALKNALTLERSYYESDTLLDSEEVINTTEIVEESMDDYDAYGTKLKDRQNLYVLKSSKDMVQEQWTKVVDAYLKNGAYNVDFVSIIKKELQNDGFKVRLFNETNEKLTPVDFKLLDYIFKHFEKITASEAQSLEYENYDYYNSDRDISSILEDIVFNYTNTSTEYVADSQLLKKTLEYYRTYLDISKTDFTAYYNYLNALKTVETDGLNLNYLDTYAMLYESVVKKDMSVIESLDASYSTKYRELSWASFKDTFAGLANTTAWYVVENDMKNTFVQKAITWSETSIAIDKTNHYYLDTLAQLYYKNGQKEKAITTEQKAIDLAVDSDNKSEYEVVLGKMKSGTY